MATSGDRTAALSEAKAALGRKDYHRAIEKATEAVAAHPKEAPAYLIRAEALRRLGKPERALADLAVAIRLQPNRPSPYVVRAEILKKRCQFDQAIADATQAIFLDPDNAAAYSIRAACRQSIGDIEGASADHEELDRIDPTRPSSPQTGQASASAHVSADRPHPAIPEDDRHVFADGRKPDRSYRSSQAITSDDAAEVLGEVSGYKPGYLPRSSARGATRSKAPSRGVGYGLGLLAVGGVVGCLLTLRGGGTAAPARTPMIPTNSVQQLPQVVEVARGPEHPQVPSQQEAKGRPAEKDAPAPAASTPPPGKKEQRLAQVRRIRFSLAEDGECRLMLDSRGDPPAHEGVGGEPASLAGVDNGVVRKLETGSYRISYSFSEAASTADFTRLNGTSPLVLQGVSADRTAGTLVMTPIKTDKLPGRSALFGFPRLVRPPFAIAVDLDGLDRGTFIIQLHSQVPSGTIGVNVAPDRGRGDVSSEVFLIPMTGGKRGAAVNLLTRRSGADGVVESGFHLPGEYDAASDRFMLEFALRGEEPASIRRVEVEAKVPPSFGLSLGPDKGGVTVKSALKGGAGEKAGFKAGDLLVSMDGEKLTDVPNTMSRLADAPIGKEVKFVVRRTGQEKTIVVKGG